MRGIDFKNPQGELKGGRCYGTKRSTIGFSSLLSWLLPSQSARKPIPIFLGIKGSKNMPQTNNLELMTYVSLGICFWVAIAANPLTIWEDDNTEGGRCNTILQALAPINIYCYCCKVTSVVSNSVRPHRGQPTRLRHPWDSPGKNTGVGCLFLLQCMKVKSGSEVAQSFPALVTPWTAAFQAPPSMGFSRQECWSGVPLLSPRQPHIGQNGHH